MLENQEKSIDFVLNGEGGFVIDNGGPTNFGITAKYLMDNDRWAYDFDKNGVIDASDMKKFSVENAKFEYFKMFNKARYNLINSLEIAKRVFDVHVNSGPRQAALITQRSYNRLMSPTSKIDIDGLIGNLTIYALNSIKNIDGFVEEFKMQRVYFYRELAESNPEKYGRYLNGWVNRANT